MSDDPARTGGFTANGVNVDDPTRWLREMLVVVLGNTEAVTSVINEGTDGETYQLTGETPGRVAFTATNGMTYEMVLFATVGDEPPVPQT